MVGFSVYLAAPPIPALFASGPPSKIVKARLPPRCHSIDVDTLLTSKTDIESPYLLLTKLSNDCESLVSEITWLNSPRESWTLSGPI